jgi:hypothetical protein
MHIKNPEKLKKQHVFWKIWQKLENGLLSQIVEEYLFL